MNLDEFERWLEGRYADCRFAENLAMREDRNYANAMMHESAARAYAKCIDEFRSRRKEQTS